MGPRMKMKMDSRKKNPLLSSLTDMQFSPDTVCDTHALGLNQKMIRLEREESGDGSSLDDTSQPTYAKAGNMRTPPTTPTLAHSEVSSSSVVAAPCIPKLPPRVPISKTRPRSFSEAEVSSSCGNRRAIFGQYWKQGPRCATNREQQRSPSPPVYNSGQHLQHSFTIPETPPPSRRNRSSSMSKIDEVLPDIKDYRMFAPSREHADQSRICRRFASVEEVPMSPSFEALPPLPTPLRRLCSDGDSPGCLQGMYPMLTPIPILKQSSYRSGVDDNNGNPRGTIPKQTWYGADASFNLTSSWRPETQVSFGSTTSNSTSGSSLSNGTGTGTTKASVRFDPRVTVTEFEDPIERIWYNDDELDRLKSETVLLAQEYLLTHPEKAESYARAVMDPLTKTMRKKALFSLPILSTIDDDTSSPEHKEYEKLVKSQVKTILIVDPNQAILNLFCKSMHSMFPSARLYKAQTAEEALQMVQTALNPTVGMSQPRHFDIIIVEQRLYTPAKQESCKSSGTNNSGNNHRPMHRVCESMFSSSSTRTDGFAPIQKTTTERMSSLDEMSQFDGIQAIWTGHERSSSTGIVLGIRLPEMMTGCRLIEMIQRLEEETFVAPASVVRAKNHKEAAVMPCTNSNKALLIGVSMHPDHDARHLKEAGADIVWGKPIPSVGEPLRNQLLHHLVDKRRQSLNGDSASSSGEQQIVEALT